MTNGQVKKLLRRAANGERILLSAARKLEAAELVFVNEGSRYRRTEFGREVGPVFVTVQLRKSADEILAEPDRIIRKTITAYAYPRNGNLHNPSERDVEWSVIEVSPSGERLLDRSSKLGPLKADWPGVPVEKANKAQ